jgi:hypothetical protein
VTRPCGTATGVTSTAPIEGGDAGVEHAPLPLGLRAPRRRRAVVEDVAELVLDGAHRRRRAVHRQLPASPLAHGAQVVDAVGVVGVVVRVQHGVQPVDPVRDELDAQLGRRVDQEPRAGVGLDHRADARAPVARVGGAAHPAVAADDGNAERRAGAEEGELHDRARRRVTGRSPL